MSVTNHHIDGDISDGISVISDCDSINDRHSPMPIKMTSQKRNVVDDTNGTEMNKTSGAEDVNNFTLAERSTDSEVQVLSGNNVSPRQYVWNPSNIIIFGLIVGAAAILSTQYWKISSSHGSIVPEMSLLSRRIQDLESENLALKIEVDYLVELHHAGHDHSRSHEKVVEKRTVKQKKVWTGADDSPIHIPKEPIKADYCNDEYLNSDDLFASYNFKKCENIDDSTKEKAKSKNVVGDGRTMTADNSSQQIESRRKKNKDDGHYSASSRREKFAESKSRNEKVASDADQTVHNENLGKIQEERQKIFEEAAQKYSERQKKMEKKQGEKKQDKNGKHRKDEKFADGKISDNQGAASDAETIRNEKLVKFQEERQKIFDEATQKYLERQNKMEKKQEKDSKHRQDAFMGSKDTDSEWYDKMMKKREELRGMRTKQQNRENWYAERANGRKGSRKI